MDFSINEIFSSGAFVCIIVYIHKVALEVREIKTTLKDCKEICKKKSEDFNE